MKRLVSIFAIVLVGACLAPTGAQAAFGLYDFDVTFTNEDGTPATQAGSHPFAMSTAFGLNFDGADPEGRLRDVFFEQVPGLVAGTTAYPRCSTLDFLTLGESGPSCPQDTVIGITASAVDDPGDWTTSPVFNLATPPGVLVRLAFKVLNTQNIFVDVGLGSEPPYLPTASLKNTPQLLAVFGSVTQLGETPRIQPTTPSAVFAAWRTSPWRPVTLPAFASRTSREKAARWRRAPSPSSPLRPAARNRSSAATESSPGKARPTPARPSPMMPPATPSPSAAAANSIPALKGVFRPRPGNANLEQMVLRLPSSAFLDQAHIRTICTRVQFAADACPPAAAYGKATAWSPLLDEPLTGPVYLRSSNNKLPDFVADLHGIVDVEAVARIDSAKGGIRATFAQVPDAPLTKVVVEMQGGKKGLIVNSRNLCAAKSRAKARMRGHNGRRHRARPQVRPLGCRKSRKR